MHQDCFAFHLLTSQDAKLQLSVFFPSDAAGPSSLHALETSWVATCRSTAISGTSKRFWSDLSDGFRGISPSREICGEHKWDETGVERWVFGEEKGQAENTSAVLLRKAVQSSVRQKVHLLEAFREGGLGVSRGERNGSQQ